MPNPPTNLARIGAVYKFRTGVPNDLLDHYAPKKEIIESLKTKDLGEARRRLLLRPSDVLTVRPEFAGHGRGHAKKLQDFIGPNQ